MTTDHRDKAPPLHPTGPAEAARSGTPPRLFPVPVDLRKPRTDPDPEPQPDIDAEPEAEELAGEQEESAVDEDPPLEGVVIGRDLPALMPEWAASWEILQAQAEWRARQGWHLLWFYGIRSPKYVFRFTVRGAVGTARGVNLLVRWLSHAEAAPLRQQAIAKLDAKEYLDLLHARNDHFKVRGIIAGATALAAGIGIAMETHVAPDALIVEGFLAWAIAAWHGGPYDDPAFFDTADLPIQLDLSADHLNSAFRAIGILKGKDDDENPPRLILVQPPMRDSHRSWTTVIDLPKGTGKSADDVLGRSDKLAAELGVDEIQLDIRRVRAVHRGHAGRLSIWICDEDPYIQDKPNLSPLAKIAECSVWEPIPFGRDARGRRVELSVMWQSMFFGGLPRRGKTAAQRLVVAAAVLDPSVRHWMADGKGGTDWRPGKRVAHRYVLGAEPDAVRALEDMLDEVIAEMERAYAKLNFIPLHLIPDGKVTPEVVRRYGLQLHWITIDELQEYLSAISDNKRKDALIERLARIARRGPAAGFFSNFASQRPDAASVPTKLREIVSYRYCTQVTDKTSSDMVLGDGKAKQGADASILSEEHVGVGVLSRGTEFTTVLTDYLTLPEFTEICERGRELRIQAGRLTGDAADDTLAGEHDDIIPMALADALEAMRHVDRMHTTDLMNRLVNLDKGTYGDWTADRLADELARAGVQRNTTQVKIDGVNRNGYHKADLMAAATMYGGPQ